MEEGIVKLVLVGVAIWLAIVIGAVVLAIVLLLVIPALSGFPLYWLLFQRRYILSKLKAGFCAGIALGMFAIGFLTTVSLHPEAFRYAPYWFIDWTFPPEVAGVWAGTILALGIVAVFLSVEAYRQVFWPYHWFMIGTNIKIMRLRAHLQKNESKRASLQKQIRKFETRFSTLLQQQQELETQLENTVRQDAAFYAAELAVCRQQYAEVSREELDQRLQQLQKEAKALPAGDLRVVTLTVESLALRLQALDEDLRTPHGVTFDQLQARHFELASSSNALAEAITHLGRLVNDARLTIRQFQRIPPIIQ